MHIFIPILFAVDPIITPTLLAVAGKWLAATAGVAMAASLIYDALDWLVDEALERLPENNRNRVQSAIATACKIWQRNRKWIKVVIHFFNIAGHFVSSSNTTQSWNSAGSDVQDYLDQGNTIQQEYSVS